MNDELAIEGLLNIAKVGQGFEKAGVKGYSKIWRDSVFYYWEQWRIPKFSRMRIHSTELSLRMINSSNKNPLDSAYDHAIPFAYLRKKLGFGIVDENNIYSYLSYIIGVNITKSEDRKLNEKKLGQRMPTDWDGIDIFARYERAGIELNFPDDWESTYGLRFLQRQGVEKI